jgi:hypothetical protein
MTLRPEVDNSGESSFGSPQALADVLPALAADWHTRLNDPLHPDQVKAMATRTA